MEDVIHEEECTNEEEEKKEKQSKCRTKLKSQNKFTILGMKSIPLDMMKSDRYKMTTTITCDEMIT